MSCCSKDEIDTKPELIIGLTGGVGTNFKQVKNILENTLNNEFNYHVFLIKLSKIHEEIYIQKKKWNIINSLIYFINGV